ncbi:EamA family transporter [Lactobacillus sp. S2-2]|uniref:DMT family transporter n=1 Tax=Lactobacillus sp. S2-2 TaxID=2692917 RepID=UPI001F21B29F|nr:DMT family transporter [Lactobacillus sp. S2-2]MCF6514646.1 EamA family transporter [Lactobacillus sp. S2-2]
MSEKKIKLMQSNVVKGIGWAALASAFWGISGTVLQYVSQTAAIPAGWYLSARTIIASVILLVIGAIIYPSKFFNVFKDKKSIICILAYGIFGLGLNLLTFYMSIQTGNAAAATILQYLSPLFILLGGLIFMRKRPQKIDIIVFVIALVGVFLAITRGDFSQLSIPMVSLLWGIGSGITAAGYVVIPRPLVKDNPSILVLGWGTFIAGVMFNIHQPVWVGVPNLNVGSVLGILSAVVLGTILPFICLLYSLNFASSEEVSLVDAIQPVMTFILSIIFFHVDINIVEVIGSILVVLAIYILQDYKRKHKKTLDI